MEHHDLAAISQHPTAFDALAAGYDDSFTNSALGQLLRPRVWRKLAQYFQPGQHVLELACGTGEDAVWLAGQGVTVTATDGAAQMVRVAQAKVEARQYANRVLTKQLSLQQISQGEALGGAPFDGVYSNFGGLNTINTWAALASSLAQLVKPGGMAILVVMGPLCPWEMIWHAAHGHFKTAFRRLDGAASATIGQAFIPIWYPSARQLRTAFAPNFQHLSTESLGLWLPPSYLDHLVKRWPHLFHDLNRFEQFTARFTTGWGDHYMLTLQRSPEKGGLHVMSGGSPC